MTTDSDIYAVILAGGSGTRFWPVSRELQPKQLCAIADPKRTMIEVTLDRLEGWIPPERRIIVTHQAQIEQTQKICGAKAGHYLAEPDRKDTANAIAIAAEYIEQVSGRPDAVMLSLHSDQVIQPEASFRDDLKLAVTGAREGRLVLIGVPPTRPETGYGYIELTQQEILPGHYDVKSFKEKPDADTAKTYLESGQFLWNTGLFCWRVDVVKKELAKQLPATVEALGQLTQKLGIEGLRTVEQLAPVYSKLVKISIDHAVLEVSDLVCAIKGQFNWVDIGSWLALAEFVEKDDQQNFKPESALVLDSTGTFISSPKFVAVVGVKNLAIVDTDDALLVCDLAASQRVKEVVSWLKDNGLENLM